MKRNAIKYETLAKLHIADLLCCNFNLVQQSALAVLPDCYQGHKEPTPRKMFTENTQCSKTAIDTGKLYALVNCTTLNGILPYFNESLLL